jgi:hypothetical protein
VQLEVVISWKEGVLFKKFGVEGLELGDDVIVIKELF